MLVFMRAYEASQQTHTAVVLYTDLDVCGAMLRGYVGRVGPINGYDFVSRAVIAWTGLKATRH